MIAREVAAMARPFGLEILYHKRAGLTPEEEREAGVTYASFKELFARSDYLSIHVPPSAETRDLVDAAALRRMKRGAFLINTSRAAIVNRDALLDAAASGHLGGVGLDVLYEEPAADMIFAEACSELSEYRAFVDALDRPHSVLANITEFSKTPAFALGELRSAGVSAALFPLSAARAMAAAALKVYEAILGDGSARNVIDMMQPRAELYEFLDYHAYEEKIDRLFAQDDKKVTGDE